jgi:hypothetical protein
MIDRTLPGQVKALEVPLAVPKAQVQEWSTSTPPSSMLDTASLLTYLTYWLIQPAPPTVWYSHWMDRSSN